MTDNQKHLNFADSVDPTEEVSVGADDMGFKGLVTMTDETGRIVFQARPNLIVLRGRTAALEQLFKHTIGNSGVSGAVSNPYLSNLNRAINGFAVGSGGSVSPSTPFEPRAVNPRDRWLTTAVPFRIHDSTASASNTDIYIPPAERPYYAKGDVVSGKPTQTAYYVKRFDNFTPTWNFNETNNEVFKEIQMTISAADCRTVASPLINELMLTYSELQSTQDANGCAVMTDIEIFSRITFPTEYLSAEKSLSVSYRIFA